MGDRCTVISLAVSSLEDAVKDPALAALMDQGWGVVASVVVQSASGGEPLLQVVLSPPRPEAEALPAWVHRTVLGMLAAQVLLLAWLASAVQL